MKQKKEQMGPSLINGISIGVLIVALIWGIMNVSLLREEALYNHTRLLVVDEIKKLEQGQLPDSPYPYAVIDLRGKVIYADPKFGYQDKVALKEVVQFDKSFWKAQRGLVKSTFIIEKDGEAVGFVLFLIPKEKAFSRSQRELAVRLFGPIAVGIMGVAIGYAVQYFYLKRRFLKPIERICLSAESIIKGDYEVAVREAMDEELRSSQIGKLTYVFELMRDELKEKQEKEKQLKKSQKELIVCISHDLKTPLSCIKAYSEGLKDGIITDPKKRQRYAEVILHKADALNSMINDLLEHSQAELNALSIDKKETYFKDYFDEVTEELKVVIQKAGMVCEIESDMPNYIIEMDTRRITQVLENLVSNAIKYSGEGKWIGIQSKLCETYLIISVKDQGKGIEYCDIPYVFNTFYRGEKSRNSAVAGSGLGLSICKYIVEAHDGKMTCTSSVGEGSCFVISIPLEKN